MPPETCSGDIEKNEMIKSVMKREVFFHLANGFFCFVFEEISSSIHMLLVMLFAHEGKRSNSSSQMFFKTGVLKNFAIFNCSLYLSQILFDDK